MRKLFVAFLLAITTVWAFTITQWAWEGHKSFTYLTTLVAGPDGKALDPHTRAELIDALARMAAASRSHAEGVGK